MNPIGERGTKVPRAISLLLALISLLSNAATPLCADEPPVLRAALRRPIAAAVLADGKTLAVANERTATISLIDLAAGRVMSEYNVLTQNVVGVSLADFALAPDRRYALAIGAGEFSNLFAADLSAAGGEHLGRLRLTFRPTSVAIAPQGNMGSITSTWSRLVQFVSFDWPTAGKSPTTVSLEQLVELDFAPRSQLWIAPDRLVVADAFGGHLALLDAKAGKVLSQHELSAHNIRGLALSANGRELVLAHQILDEHAATSLENIERGTLMRNVIRRIPLPELEKTEPPLNDRSRIKELGMPERGAADPAGIVLGENDTAAIAFAGVNEVELGRLDESAPDSAVRLSVGRRPTAIVRYGASGLAVLNTFDDSISLIDLTERKVTQTISLGPSRPLTPQDRGELLFFDGRLARDGWMSCHSCHSGGHTAGLRADTLGDNTYGTPKRTPTLLGAGLTYRWAWNGQFQNLHDQVQKSLEQTMHAGAYDPAAVGDLTAYLVWLPPPPPLSPSKTDSSVRDQITRGEKLFHSLNCADCHIPPLAYTSNEAFDVGLTDEKGQKKFNPPSLRGVGQGYSFLHDGRAKSLPDVFRDVGHPHGQTLTGPELDDLVRFLKSL